MGIKRFTPIVVVAAAALLGVGLESDAASSRADVAPCPQLSEVASLPLRPDGGRLRGDIDGDGALDHVSVRYAPKSHASCGFLLAVRTRSRLLAVRVPEWYKPPQDLLIRDWWLQEPFLAALVQLDPHRAQIVVARSHGASVVSVSLYGIVGGTLLPLHHPSPFQNALPLFGTVGTGDTNARCLRGGPLILLGKGPTTASGRRWFISRSEYRLIKSRFRQTRTRTVRSSWKRVNALAQRWGMSALPFTGCTVARGRRL